MTQKPSPDKAGAASAGQRSGPRSAGRARRSGSSRRRGARPSVFAERLGVVGWAALEPVLLASLATEAPLLLVGPHGTAKSYLVERLAGALGLVFRHYNAALINYDDLVGIPLPDDAGERLRFVGVEGAVWDAGFVFLDEISRCRADLQNKLFPIVHERRVAGMDLPALRHRWAAMNPPSSDDLDASPGGAGEGYLGSEPLDAALADRFAFVVRVPTWEQLTRKERLRLVGARAPRARGRTRDTLPALVEQVAGLVERLDEALRGQVADYVVQLMAQLEAASLPQSPRRARMLASAVIAVHAARVVLEGDEAELEESARMAVSVGLPETCSEAPPAPATLLGAHRQAWEIAELEKDSAWRQVLEEPDAARRVVLADKLGLCTADVSRLATRALGAEMPESRRMGLATAMFLRFRASRDLWPSAWEPIVRYAQRVLAPREMNARLSNGSTELGIWQEINRWFACPGEGRPQPSTLERNYLLGGFPDLWLAGRWDGAVEAFRRDLELFEVGRGGRR